MSMPAVHRLSGTGTSGPRTAGTSRPGTGWANGTTWTRGAAGDTRTAWADGEAAGAAEDRWAALAGRTARDNRTAGAARMRTARSGSRGGRRERSGRGYDGRAGGRCCRARRGPAEPGHDPGRERATPPWPVLRRGRTVLRPRAVHAPGGGCGGRAGRGPGGGGVVGGRRGLGGPLPVVRTHPVIVGTGVHAGNGVRGYAVVPCSRGASGAPSRSGSPGPATLPPRPAAAGPPARRTPGCPCSVP